jgi:ABC-type Fe3+-hydroxamate transport system substrate-binding protein
MSVRDGRGVELDLGVPPSRVVSLVPSTTETLFDLGVGPRVVGRTRFCIHPADRVGAIEVVGGTKQVDEGRIRALRPDLVLANCEENTAEMLANLGADLRVYAAFPRTVDEAVADLHNTAALLHVDAAPVISAIASARADLVRTPFSYAYLIWREPLMTVNDDTFIASMLAEIGGVNAFADRPTRFPAVTAAALAEAAPDVVLLSSEPFPFKDRHIDELSEQTGLPPTRFALVDGEMCSWHGTRMARALPYLGQLRSRLDTLSS